MNLKMKSETELRTAVRSSRGREKTAVLEVLHHLNEIESRGLQLKWGFASIYDYCMTELNYTKDEAYYRIQAMRILKAVPTAEEKMLAGDVSLTTLVKTQIAFNNENKRRHQESLTAISKDEKAEVLTRIAEAPARDCEKILAERFPEAIHPLEQTKTLARGRTLIQLSVNAELLQKLEKLKDFVAHKSFDRSWEGLLDVIADIAPDQVDPVAIQRRRDSRKKDKRTKKSEASVTAHVTDRSERPLAALELSAGKNSQVAEVKVANVQSLKVGLHLEAGGSAESCISRSREDIHVNARTPMTDSSRAARKYISRSLNRDVWVTANSQCEFVDPESGRRCASQHGLQTDHRKPIAMGGGNDRENLRLLSGAHNRYEANRILKHKKRADCRQESNG